MSPPSLLGSRSRHCYGINYTHDQIIRVLPSRKALQLKRATSVASTSKSPTALGPREWSGRTELSFVLSDLLAFRGRNEFNYGFVVSLIEHFENASDVSIKP